MPIQLYARCAPRYPIGVPSVSARKLQLMDPSNTNTYWLKESVSGGYIFRLYNNQSLVLTATSANFGDLYVSSYTGAANQIWNYYSTGMNDGSHRLYASNNSKFCIDVNYGHSTIGSEVSMFSRDTSLDQCILEVNVGSSPEFACTSSNHNWVDSNVTSNATCTSTGSKVQKCSICGQTRTVSIPALGHNYVNESTVAATCTSGGYTTQRCSRCGATRSVNGAAALGHSYGSWVTRVEPTCTVAGSQERMCSRCGAKETSSIPALGHIAAESLRGYVAPTHTQPGYSGDVVCSRCGTVISAGHEIAAQGHNMGPWSPLDAESHIRICSNGAACHQEVEAHTFGNWVIDVPPTCTTDGSKSRTCSVCGHKETQVISATGHLYNDGEITTSPGCLSEGVKTFTCTKCGNTQTESIDCLGHDYSTPVVEKVPTRGTFGVMKCSCGRCDYAIITPFIKLKHRKPSSI